MSERLLQVGLLDAQARGSRLAMLLPGSLLLAETELRCDQLAHPCGVYVPSPRVSVQNSPGYIFWQRLGVLTSGPCWDYDLHLYCRLQYE